MNGFLRPVSLVQINRFSDLSLLRNPTYSVHGAGAGLSRFQNYSGFLGNTPVGKLSSFRGPKDTLESMGRIALGDRGEKSFLVRQFTEFVVKEIQPKDYLGEILAIRNCFLQKSPIRDSVPMFRYMNDPLHVEWIKDPQRQVEEIISSGSTIVDCDEIALMGAVMNLQLGRDVEFVALGFAPRQLTHVGVRVLEPKSKTWIWVDPVAGPREEEAARRAKEILKYSLS